MQKTVALSALNGEAFEVKRTRFEETTVTSSQVAPSSSRPDTSMRRTAGGQVVLNRSCSYARKVSDIGKHIIFQQIMKHKSNFMHLKRVIVRFFF